MLLQAIKPFRSVLRWQALTTAAAALVAALTLGVHAALSAALGGGVGIVTGLGFILTLARSRAAAPSAGQVLGTALRAEAVKILLTIALLWLTFAVYAQLVAIVFIAVFALSVIIFSLAAFARAQQVTAG